jgi:hypothetical protein
MRGAVGHRNRVGDRAILDGEKIDLPSPSSLPA